jgi:hypothetical protein
MEINQALIEAVTRELLKRLGDIEIAPKPQLFIVGQTALSDAVLAALKAEYDVVYSDKCVCQGGCPPDALVLCKHDKCTCAEGHAAAGESCCGSGQTGKYQLQGGGDSCGVSCLAGPPPVHVAQWAPKRGKKVWSEGDFMKACPSVNGPGQSITVGENDLVTPLAVDYAAKNQITINRA